MPILHPQEHSTIRRVAMFFWTRHLMNPARWRITICRGSSAGSLVAQPELARSYRQIAADGGDALYRGDLGLRL